jgi:hypothetical protein
MLCYQLLRILLFTNSKVLVNQFLGKTQNFARLKFTSLILNKSILSTSHWCCHFLVCNILFYFFYQFFSINPSHSVEIIFNISLRGLKKFTSSFSNNFKTINLRFVMINFWWKDYSILIML